MKVTFLGQGLSQGCDSAVGEQIKQAFADKRFKSLVAFVAFASKPAATFLVLQSQTNPSVKVHIYVGVDLKGTSKEALETLLESGISTVVFHTISREIFHPKVYLFRGDNDACLIVGSSNLTAPGFYANVESSVRIDFNFTKSPGRELLQQVKEFFDPLVNGTDNVHVVDQELINLLHVCGRLPSESERASSQEASKDTDKGNKAFDDLEKLFPTRLTSHMPPIALAGSKKGTSALKTGTGASGQSGISWTTGDSSPASSATPKQTTKFWIEARKLTSGSRNQLDLSTHTKFKVIPGSLSLFGLNGTNTNTVKKITIQYNGVDYKDNTIYFPETPAGKTNHTWRMQMNGTSVGGQSLTPYGRTDFVDRMLIFEKIGTDHYKIAPVSASLAHLQKISKRWDKNHGNGRCFGEL